MAISAKVTLRIYSKNHSLDELSDLLSEPTDGCSIGEIYTKSGKTREYSYWGIESSCSQKSTFEEHLSEIINFYEFNLKKLTDLISNDCEIDISCFLDSDNGQGGFTLPNILIKKLELYSLNIHFDFYSD